MSRFRTILIGVAGVVLLTGAMISSDLAYWALADRFRPPVRDVILDDHDYYLMRVHAALMAGRPIGSPFYLEHADSEPRYAVFETTVVLIGRVLASVRNMTAWAALLDGLSIVAVFLGLAWIFARWFRWRPDRALLVAFLFTAWAEPVPMFKYHAMRSWFLPFVLFGVIALRNAFAATVPWRRFAWFGAALFALAVHPVPFAIGLGAATIVWAVRLKRSPNAAVALQALAWASLALAVAALFYSRHALPDPGAAAATLDTLRRGGLVESRLPSGLTASLTAAGALILVLLCRRRADDPTDRETLLVVAALFGAALFGLNSNVVTGKFFMADHFQFFEHLFIVIAAGAAFAAKPSVPARGERVAAWAAIGMTSVYAAELIVDYPIRAFLVTAATLPYFASAAFLGWAALGKPALPRPRHPIRDTMLVGLFIVTALYPFVLFWRLNRVNVAKHAEVQAIRPALDVLQSLPAGVVMASPRWSAIVTLQTAQRPYWHNLAFIDLAPTAELLDRWREELPFFPDEPRMHDANAHDGTFGLEEGPCGHPLEVRLYRPLKEAGWLKESLCRGAVFQKDWPDYVASAIGNATSSAASWRPTYRLDYLLIDRAAGEAVPGTLGAHFKEAWSDDRFTLYRYLP